MDDLVTAEQAQKWLDVVGVMPLGSRSWRPLAHTVVYLWGENERLRRHGVIADVEALQADRDRLRKLILDGANTFVVVDDSSEDAVVVLMERDVWERMEAAWMAAEATTDTEASDE